MLKTTKLLKVLAPIAISANNKKADNSGNLKSNLFKSKKH